MRCLLPLFALLLSGCGTYSNPIRRLGDLLKAPNLSPEQISALGAATSYTGQSLSYFVIGGCILTLAGVVCMAFGPSRGAGVILAVGGAGCAFAGYAIEEYAYYFIIFTMLAITSYGCFTLGSKWGRRLGFEQGKDYYDEQE